MNPEWWRDFWGAYDNVKEKYDWRQSVHVDEAQSEITSKWFLDAVKKLRDKTEIFIQSMEKEGLDD